MCTSNSQHPSEILTASTNANMKAISATRNATASNEISKTFLVLVGIFLNDSAIQ